MAYQALLARSARQVWLGGEQGVAFFDGERTRLEDLGLTAAATVYALAASSPADVYAVGSGGLVVHFDGVRWALEDAGTSVALRAVQVLQGGEVVAAGDDGTLRLRAATGRWAPPQGDFPGQDFVAAASLPSGEAALASAQGALVVRTDGGGFELLDTTPLGEVRAMARLGSRLYVGGGVAGAWLSWRDVDGGWTSLLDGADPATTLQALTVDGQDLWAVGQGLLQRFGLGEVPGSNLGAGALASVRLLGGAAVRPGEVLAGGEDGALAVASADGGLRLRSAGLAVAVTALCGSSRTSLLATVACPAADCVPGVLARSEAVGRGRWTLLPAGASATPRPLTACFGEDATHAWILGEDSRFDRWDGVQLSPGDFGPGLAGVYTSAWGRADAGYLFVRQPGGAKRGELVSSPDGVGSFTPLLKNSGVRAVWGVAEARWAGAVGDLGAFHELDPTGTWVARAAPSTTSMRALHASPWDAGGAWFVAAGEDTTWTRQGTGSPVVDRLPGASLAAAWTSVTGTGWVAGSDSAGRALVARRDAGAGGWTPVPLLLARPLTALLGVDGSGTQTVWVGGDGGLLLRLETR
jgi:hypothetical protein